MATRPNAHPRSFLNAVLQQPTGSFDLRFHLGAVLLAVQFSGSVFGQQQTDAIHVLRSTLRQSEFKVGQRTVTLHRLDQSSSTLLTTRSTVQRIRRLTNKQERTEKECLRIYTYCIVFRADKRGQGYVAPGPVLSQELGEAPEIV